MTTMTQLARFRSQLPAHSAARLSPNTNFRELWSDALAIVAAVTLFSILAFEMLRLVVP